MPNILPRLRKLSKTGNPTYAPAQIERTRDPFKKKGEKKKNLHRHRSHHFTFLNVTNYCIFSSAHNQPPLELESISPLLLLPPPSSLLCIPYTIHTHDPLRIFDRNLSVGNCGDGSHRPRHEAEFSSFKGDKGRWLRAWHKNPGHPFEKRNKQGRKEGERDANRRTNGRASQDKSNIGVIRS